MNLKATSSKLLRGASVAVVAMALSGIAAAEGITPPTEPSAAGSHVVAATSSSAAQLLKAQARLVDQKQHLAFLESELAKVEKEVHLRFGPDLPSTAEANRLSSLASAELRALTPVMSETPARADRKARIAALNAAMREAQQKSAQQYALAQQGTADEKARVVADMRSTFESVNAELVTLYAAQNKDFDDSIADPAAYMAKKAELRAYVRLGEIEDRKAVLQGVRQTVAQTEAQVLKLSQDPTTAR